MPIGESGYGGSGEQGQPVGASGEKEDEVDTNGEDNKIPGVN